MNKRDLFALLIIIVLAGTWWFFEKKETPTTTSDQFDITKYTTVPRDFTWIEKNATDNDLGISFKRPSFWIFQEEVTAKADKKEYYGRFRRSTIINASNISDRNRNESDDVLAITYSPNLKAISDGTPEGFLDVYAPNNSAGVFRKTIGDINTIKIDDSDGTTHYLFFTKNNLFQAASYKTSKKEAVIVEEIISSIKLKNEVFVTPTNWKNYPEDNVSNTIPHPISLEKVGYLKDANYVYKYVKENKEIVKGADPETIEVISMPENLNDDPSYPFVYLKDKSSVYVDGQKVEGSDPESFKIISDGKYYAADKNNVYVTYYNDAGKFITSKINNADPISFRALSELGMNGCGPTPFYSTDKTNIYYKDKVILNSDISSFSILNMGYAKDKNNVYKGADIVKGVDPSTFQPPVCTYEG